MDSGEIRLLWNEFSFYTVVHFLAGVLTVLSVVVTHPIVAGIAFVGFMVYELNEDRHLRDHAYKDILEYCIGVYVAIVCVCMWWLV